VAETLPNWEKIKDLTSETNTSLDYAQEVLALLPIINKALDGLGATDVPEETITHIADELKKGQHTVVGTSNEDGNSVYERLNGYPHLIEAFEDDSNWVETDGGLLIKRSAINPYVVRNDGREITDEADINARTMAIGNFYKVWLGSIPEEERPTQKYSRIPLLTKEQMADFALFIANPPDIPGVPRSYTIQKKTAL